jgi:fusion and transport protein UGO1
MPWEVGKLLLQVQWVPRDTGDPSAELEEEGEDEEEEADAVSGLFL